MSEPITLTAMAVGALLNIVANRTDRTIDWVTDVLSRLGEEGKIPPNHDVANACRLSLRKALRKLAQDMDLEVERPRNWVQAFANRLDRHGNWKPALEWWSTSDGEWFREFVAAIESDHALNRFDLRQAMESPNLLRAARNRSTAEVIDYFNAAMVDWTDRTVQRGTRPAFFADWIHGGWPMSRDERAPRITLYQVWCLHFQDHLKKNSDVSRILVADWLGGLDEELRNSTAALGELGAHLDEGFGDLRRAVERLQAELDRIFDAVAKRPHLDLSLFAFEPGDVLDIRRLDYRRERTKFASPHELMSRLEYFLRPNPEANAGDVAWCLLTAPSGCGKSRLAAELCKEARRNGFHAGFLLATDDESWSKALQSWVIDADTLVVVDYAAMRAEDARKLICRFARVEKNNLRQGARLRVLLLETPIAHRVDSWWKKRLFGWGIGNDSDYLLGTLHVPRGSQRPRRFEQIEPLAMPKIEDDCLLRIVGEVFDELGLPEARRPTPESILRGLGKVDPERRPLFAMLYAEAVWEAARQGPQHHSTWTGNQLDLLHGILDRQFAHWTKRWGDRLDSAHVNLLVLASLCESIGDDQLSNMPPDGCTLPDPKGAASDANTLDHALYRHLTIGQYGETRGPLVGLKPTLLAQALYLARLAGREGVQLACERNVEAISRETARLAHRAFQIDPHCVLWFCGRTLFEFHPAEGTSELLDTLADLPWTGRATEHPSARLALAMILKRFGRDEAASRVLREMHASDAPGQEWRETARFVLETLQLSGRSASTGNEGEFRLAGRFADRFVRNTASPEHFDRFCQARDRIVDGKDASPPADKASLATFLMMAAWGTNMRYFGGESRKENDRVRIFSAIAEKVPRALQVLTWSGRRHLVLDERSPPLPDGRHQMNLGTVRGVSLIFPTNERTFGGAFLRGERSLYDLTADDILSPDEESESNRPLFIVDLVLVLDGLFDLYLRQEIGYIFDGWESSEIAEITERVDLLSAGERGPKTGLLAFPDHFQSLRSQYAKRPIVVAPFTGRGLGEPFARRWHKGGVFELRDNPSADGDKLYVFRWDPDDARQAAAAE
jgi:hypothetical protein